MLEKFLGGIRLKSGRIYSVDISKMERSRKEKLDEILPEGTAKKTRNYLFSRPSFSRKIFIYTR